jgi:uncharacterized protein YndB with AHSA1/START domain
LNINPIQQWKHFITASTSTRLLINFGGHLLKLSFTRNYWGGLEIESDWQVGSPVKMAMPWGGKLNDLSGIVLQSDPPNLLSYTGIGGPESAVTFEIKKVSENEVRLNITHEGVSDKAKKSISEGWYAIMSSLKALMETGIALDHSWWKG